MRRKTRQVGGIAKFLSFNFYLLLALSSQLSVLWKLRIMSTFVRFYYVSHVVVSGTYLWWSPYSLPRLDQKVLPRFDEYDDVITVPLFSLVSGPPTLSPPLLTFMLENYDASMLQTNGLHWQQPRNCFFALATSKIFWVSFKISIMHSHFHYCLSFRGWHLANCVGRIIELATKTDQFCKAQRHVESCVKRKQVCPTLF